MRNNREVQTPAAVDMNPEIEIALEKIRKCLHKETGTVILFCDSGEKPSIPLNDIFSDKEFLAVDDCFGTIAVFPEGRNALYNTAFKTISQMLDDAEYERQFKLMHEFLSRIIEDFEDSKKMREAKEGNATTL